MLKLKCFWLFMETTLVSQGGFEDLVVVPVGWYSRRLELIFGSTRLWKFLNSSGS